MWNVITDAIAVHTGRPFVLEQRLPVSGGCINQGYCLQGQGQAYFVKINQSHQVDMFAAEALGLQHLAATHTIRVPRPICHGVSGGQSYLVLEWLDFGPESTEAWTEMGRRLAALHAAPGPLKFGWEQDNTIGSTPQINTWTLDWASFFTEHRLAYQLQLAQRKGGQFPQTQALLEHSQRLLAGHQPPPALVHGDLWSGNTAVLTTGEPVILDPATYYGDPEVDLAMTELFGGFPAAFYRGYQETRAIPSDYQVRKTLYNLYHILNHFNLFGGGYAGQAQRMIQQILATPV
jgi:fructosamine-3-kinase